jgi:hypothetical protein
LERFGLLVGIAPIPLWLGGGVIESILIQRMAGKVSEELKCRLYHLIFEKNDFRAQVID